MWLHLRRSPTQTFVAPLPLNPHIRRLPTSFPRPMIRRFPISNFVCVGQEPLVHNPYAHGSDMFGNREGSTMRGRSRALALVGAVGAGTTLGMTALASPAAAIIGGEDATETYE